MATEIVDSFATTCTLVIQYYLAIKKNVIRQNLHRSPRKLRMFIRGVSKTRPLLRLDSGNEDDIHQKDVLKMIQQIHGWVMNDLMAWVTKNPRSNIIKHINNNIEEYQQLIRVVKPKSRLTKHQGKAGRCENKAQKKIQNEDDATSSDSEFIPMSDEESSDSNSDSETETESESESESDTFTKSSCNATRKREQLHVLQRAKDKWSKEVKAPPRTSKSTGEFDIAKLKTYLHERMTSSVMPIKKQIASFEALSSEEQRKIIEMISHSRVATCPLMYRVMLSSLPDALKHDVVERLGSLEKNDDESPKYREWVNAALKIPIGKTAVSKLSVTAKRASSKKISSKIKAFIQDTQKCLDSAVYGHADAKQQILQFVAQTVTNNDSKGIVLGIQGPMGNGKTTLIEKGFAKALGRPFATIPLGGIQDGSFLDGHGYTYEGSRWGQIVNVLMETQCMNPIIYMDELDKVSQTAKGDEITNMLIHLIDPSQNSHFRDKYFSDIDIDLSKVTFIFSYNDRDAINPILMDRITNLKTRGFRAPDKLIICRKHLLSSIMYDVGIKHTDIQLEDTTLDWIIRNYTHEGGVRQLKKICYEIIREINLRHLTNKKFKYPYLVQQSELESDILSRYTKHTIERIHPHPMTGKINGLYATCNDTGGITQIEASWIPCDADHKLQLTGNQGKVMQESMHVANTVAWNILPQESQEKLKAEWNNKGHRGVHLHCPEGGVPKDGPSAGAAITTAIYSLLTGRKIRNDVGITGEINLSGKVMAIGGLESKIFGAKLAGCTKVLCPKDNANDLHKIMQRYPDIQDEKFQIKMVDEITDVFKVMILT